MTAHELQPMLTEYRDGEFLCFCSNCETIMYDENPQRNAKKYYSNGLFPERMVQCCIEFKGQGDTEYYWACPKCLTDSYLQDL